MSQFKAIISSYIGVLVFAAFIFLGAGKWMYWQGLLYVGVALVGTTLNHLLLQKGSTLTAERAAEAQLGEAWDKKLLGLIFLLNLVTFVVAGVDSGRFPRPVEPPLVGVVLGVVLMLAGQVLFAVAKRVNESFSSTVRIIDSRAHPVCTEGPYRWLRHPGYLGLLMSSLAFPLVLEAYWAFIPASLGAALLVLRTYWEDRFLQEKLPGYAQYAAQTRWRLLPGIF